MQAWWRGMQARRRIEEELLQGSSAAHEAAKSSGFYSEPSRDQSLFGKSSRLSSKQRLYLSLPNTMNY